MLISITDNDDGFSIVELLVAMTIAAVVMIGLGTLAIGGFNNAQKSEAERQSFDDITQVSRNFSDDITRSKSPQRTEDIVSNSNAFSKTLLQDEPMTYQDGGNTVTVDVADILYASGTEIRMRTDRDILKRPSNMTNPGSDRLGQDGMGDCIRYYLDLQPGNIARVVREVVLYQPPVGSTSSRGVCNTAVFTERQVMIERVKVEVGEPE